MRDDYTEIALILDRSGSMECLRDETISSVNNFLEGQRKLPGECRVTLVQFDNAYEVNYESKSLRMGIEPLTRETYAPRGFTALLDAIGRTVSNLGDRLALMAEKDRPGKVIVVIITDGQENSSKEYTKERVAQMTKRQTEEFNWQFLYLGANQDAIQVGAGMGFARGQTMSYSASPAGVAVTSQQVGDVLAAYRSGQTKEALFSDEQREKQDSLINISIKNQSGMAILAILIVSFLSGLGLVVIDHKITAYEVEARNNDPVRKFGPVNLEVMDTAQSPEALN